MASIVGHAGEFMEEDLSHGCDWKNSMVLLNVRIISHDTFKHTSNHLRHMLNSSFPQYEATLKLGTSFVILVRTTGRPEPALHARGACFLAKLEHSPLI
jgi:hypothetical protein